MGKDRNTNQGPLTQAAVPRDRRRRPAPSMLLAACGGGTATPPGAGGGGGGGGQFGEGKDYTGPNVSLAFWNGFTGGDGPFMKQLVDQFNTEHQNIKVSMNMLQWADFYPKVPTAVQSGNGPDVGDHAHRPAGHQRRPPGHHAGGRHRHRAGARPGRLRPEPSGRPASTRSSATASRWTSTRWLFYYNQKDLEKAGISEAPTDRAGFEAAAQGDEVGRASRTRSGSPSTWPAHLMCVVADLAVRRRAVQRGRLQGPRSTPTPGVEALHLAGRQHQEGLQPQERRQRRPGGRLPAAARTPSPGTASG